MAIKDKLTDEFLQAINEMDVLLPSLLFKKNSFLEKGLAYYVEYRRENNTRVKFLFGPSDWDIEMIIYTSKGKFEFKDLLNIAEVNRWVNVNRYKQEGGGRI